MELELAIVLSCTDTGCDVRTVENDDQVETRYSSAVQDRIMISPGELVVIDKSSGFPETIWRWVPVRVDRLEEERVIVIDKNHKSASVADVPQLNLSLQPGDDVWTCGVGYDYEVHDKIIEGKPEHPEQLLTYIEPIIIKVTKDSLES
jgi:hypothetical protein